MRAQHRQRFSVGASPRLGHGNPRLPRKILPGQRSWIRFNFRRRACGHQIPACLSGAGSQVHHVVRAADRFFVMLHHKHRVAQIAQRFQRVQQAAVVARVQANRRFIEHVEHAAQPRTNLRGQPDALRLAAGKSCGRTVEREIAQSDSQQKIDALADFAQRTPGDFSLPQREVAREFCPTAARASVSGKPVKSAIEKPAIFTARLSGRSRRSPHAVHGTGDMYCVSHSRYVSEFDSERLASRWRKNSLKVQSFFPCRRLQDFRAGSNSAFCAAIDRTAYRDRIRKQPRQSAACVAEMSIPSRARGRLRTSGFAPIHDYFRRIEIVFRAEAVAFRASAIGRIEAERTRLELRHRNTAIRDKPAFRNRRALRRPPPRSSRGRRSISAPSRWTAPAAAPRRFSAAAGPPPLQSCDSCGLSSGMGSSRFTRSPSTRART